MQVFFVVALFSRETWSRVFLICLPKCSVFPERQKCAGQLHFTIIASTDVHADWNNHFLFSPCPSGYNCVKVEDSHSWKHSGFHKMLCAKMHRQTESRSRHLANYSSLHCIVWSRPRPSLSSMSLSVSQEPYQQNSWVQGPRRTTGSHPFLGLFVQGYSGKMAEQHCCSPGGTPTTFIQKSQSCIMHGDFWKYAVFTFTRTFTEALASQCFILFSTTFDKLCK